MEESHKPTRKLHFIHMAISTLLLLLLTSFCISPTMAQNPSNDGRETYIIHVEQEPADTPSFSINGEREQWHKSFLPAGISSSGQPKLIYSYKHVVSGFAASLTHEELAEIKKKPGFLHATPEGVLHLTTTHSPSFLGLHRYSPGFWNSSSYGKGVIIGVLDTGITPEHPSFSGKGMPPPPTKWKGKCNFNGSECNNKLIGARTFVNGSQPDGPYDDDGHGTHTSSTAAGMFVENANINGLANGTAAGMAPLAHLAMYKVCGVDVCYSSDMLAGMDQAVDDGVDIISVSLGGDASSFFDDISAVGSFGAMERGVLVSFAAGNSGADPNTTNNNAPWAITVGASTLDRDLRTSLKFNTSTVLNGQSAYQPKNYRSSPLPLVYPGSVSPLFATCNEDGFVDVDVTGMAVLCDDGEVEWVEKGKNVKDAGGAAMIIASTPGEGYITFASPHVLPAMQVSADDGHTIKQYMSSASDATATFSFHGAVYNVTPSPVMAYFSSRGPNAQDPNVLKPDIVAPGVNILAAWPNSVGPDPSIRANFNIISGTSMSTPHISGIAALLKSAHPDWSPAAIKSAIMTSASSIGNDGKPIADYTLEPADNYALGAGLVNPAAADTPGLIYEINPTTYIPYLCGLGYNDVQVATIVRRPIHCAGVTAISGSELNLPSFSVKLAKFNNFKKTVTRTVTYVGDAASKYTVEVDQPRGSSVTVNPKTLSFSHANEEAQFSVTFSVNSTAQFGNNSHGSLTWVSADGKTRVRSPIVVAVSR